MVSGSDFGFGSLLKLVFPEFLAGFVVVRGNDCGRTHRWTVFLRSPTMIWGAIRVDRERGYPGDDVGGVHGPCRSSRLRLHVRSIHIELDGSIRRALGPEPR